MSLTVCYMHIAYKIGFQTANGPRPALKAACGDVDVDRLKRSRLRALARAAGISALLDDWVRGTPRTRL